jgi:hypothetical protein
VLVDDTLKTRKVIRSAAVGVLFPPRVATETTAAGDVKTQSASTSKTVTEPLKTVRLAGDVIHDRPLDEVVREIATSFKKLHPAPASTDAKK